MALFRALSGGGGGDVTEFTVVAESSSAVKTLTITGKAGKTLLVVLYTWSSSSLSYTRYDNSTITGGTLTKLTNLSPTNALAAGTFFKVDVTDNNCIISNSNSFGYRVFEAG